jgi:hypothetical protein
MQKKYAFEVIPRALVKTVRFPEGQAYENVQDAVFGTAYALAMRLKERRLECYSVDLLVNYHDVFSDGKQSYYDAIELFVGVNNAMEIVKLVMVMYENHISRETLIDGISIALRELKRKARSDS